MEGISHLAVLGRHMAALEHNGGEELAIANCKLPTVH
jgi:hypothetical protein